MSNSAQRHTRTKAKRECAGCAQASRRLKRVIMLRGLTVLTVMLLGASDTVRGAFNVGDAEPALTIPTGMSGTLAGGGAVFESGEAGDLPGTAQLVVGAAGTEIESITGRFTFDGDVDMFAIRIDDSAGFSASTDNDGNQLSFFRDTQLFLFDPDGFGLLGADGTDTNIFRSELPIGSFAGPPGDYLLAVSDYDNDPVNVSGEIFPDLPIVGTFGPTGPGGPLAVADWNADFRTPELGQYRIDLTGAVVIPEPGSAILLVSGYVLVASYKRRTRQAIRARQGDNPARIGSRVWRKHP